MATHYRDILIINAANDEQHADDLLDLLKKNNVADKIDTHELLVDYNTTLQNIDAAMSKTRLLLVLISQDWCNDKEAKGHFLTALQKTFSEKKGEERQAKIKLVYMLPEGCKSRLELPYYKDLPGYGTMITYINWKLDNSTRFSEKVKTLLENIETLQQKPPTESTATGTSPSASRDETDHRKQTGTTMQCDVGWAKTLIKEGKAYKMSSSPRGRAVIINNYTFDNPKNNREGAEIDTINLEKLLTELYFTVEAHENKSSQEIREIIKDEQVSQDHGDCFILFLLSHGESGSIYGIDKTTVNLQEEVIVKFYANACPALKDKPVLIFIQAGRDNINQGQSFSEEELCKKMEKVNMDACISDAAGNDIQGATRGDLGEISYDGGIISDDLKASDAKDVVVINATVDGCKAYRNVNKGSLLVTAIVDQFSAHCHEKDLLHLMLEISAGCHGCHGLLVPECTSRMNKKLYFFPGYFE